MPSVLLKLKQVTTAMVDLPRGTTPFKEADERCIALSDCASSKCSSLYSAFYYTSPKLKWFTWVELWNKACSIVKLWGIFERR